MKRTAIRKKRELQAFNVRPMAFQRKSLVLFVVFFIGFGAFKDTGFLA